MSSLKLTVSILCYLSLSLCSLALYYCACALKLGHFVFTHLVCITTPVAEILSLWIHLFCLCCFAVF